MKSAVAVLTFNRVEALQTLLDGLLSHCAQYPIAIFEDCGQLDATAAFLTHERARSADQSLAKELLAEEWELPGQPGGASAGRPYQVFLGSKNLGVAGNSNRALRWFNQRHPDCDHLCLLNDDLHVLGDFVKVYGDAHADIGIGMFCFCDFEGETYRWENRRVIGRSGALYSLKLMPRMTGIMMSMTRDCTDTIGYFDPRVGLFGEEHCDYTNRARQAMKIAINGQDVGCVDLAHQALAHQEVPTSVSGADRERADAEASQAMALMCSEYPYRHPYRPYLLSYPKMVSGRDGMGIPRGLCQGYKTC